MARALHDIFAPLRAAVADLGRALAADLEQFLAPLKEDSVKLTRPDGSPDDHQRAAAAYEAAVRVATTPAKVLADETGLPVVTVHRWIAEARRRGHLPPGRQGLVGTTTGMERVAAVLNISADSLREIIREHAPGGLRL